MTLPDEDWSSPIEYKVVVQPGGELPLNPMAHAEMSLRLIQTPDETGQPVIDGEAVLDALNFRGRREIMKRKQERLQGAADGAGKRHRWITAARTAGQLSIAESVPRSGTGSCDTGRGDSVGMWYCCQPAHSAFALDKCRDSYDSVS